MLDIAGTYQIKLGFRRAARVPGSAARADWSYGGGTGRAGLDRARLAGRAPAQVAAVLTGTAAIIGSRGQMKGPMRLEASGS